MLDVVCVKWGAKYGPEYVNILRDMVGRSLFTDYRFICFTDDPSGLNDNIEIRLLPEGLNGWWNKLYLFSEEANLGRVLYFDLDTVITGRLEEIATYGGKFAILRDFYRSGGYGSGVMMWEPGFGKHIWQSYKESGFPEIEGGDQAWIEQQVEDADILQGLYPKAFASYKVNATSWPSNETKVVCFHGHPNPHEVDGWVKDVWKIGGMAEPELHSRCNVEIETLQRQIAENLKRGLPRAKHGTQSKTMLLVAGGPSLKGQLQELRKHKRNGHIWAMNHAHDWLLGRGIKPDFMLMLDAREDNVKFVQNPQKDVYYYVASQCHPNVFEALKGYNVTTWNAYQPELQETLIESHEEGEQVWMLGGGGTVGLKALYLGYGLGYKKFRLYGYDSCYQGDQHHAYKQSLNDGERTLTVWAGDEKFTCAPWMLKQAQDYQTQAQHLIIQEGCEIKVYGKGLIPTIHKHIGANYAS